MQVQLILVGLGVVQDLHIAALHAHCQPLPSGAVPQGEDLRGQTVQCPLCPWGWSSSRLNRVRSLLFYPLHLQTKQDNQLSAASPRYPRGVICISLRKLALGGGRGRVGGAAIPSLCKLCSAHCFKKLATTILHVKVPTVKIMRQI